MSNEPINKSAQIKTTLSEYTKTFVQYDGSGRPILVVVARHDAPVGEPAAATQYTYADPTTTRVSFQLEFDVEWDGAWDLATFPPIAIRTGGR